MRTQYYTASSLDGFVATSDHSLDWLLRLGDVEDTSYPAFIAEVGALVMGSHTYEWILRHGAGEGRSDVAAWPYQQPAWVLTTRRLPVLPGADVRFAQGDVTRVHRAMAEAAGGRNLWVVGGGDVAGQFHDRGLLDEVIVQVAPVTLGSGIPLLPRTLTTPPLRLTSTRVYGDTFVELRYSVVRPGL
jgi:dihydrofolate reductase